MMSQNSRSALAALLLLGSGILAAWTTAPQRDRHPATHARITTETYVHPVAALAWADAHCHTHVALTADAPRLQAEDLLTMSAALDERRALRGLTATCAEALLVAAPVTADASTQNGKASKDIMFDLASRIWK